MDKFHPEWWKKLIINRNSLSNYGSVSGTQAHCECDRGHVRQAEKAFRVQVVGDCAKAHCKIPRRAREIGKQYKNLKNAISANI